MSNNMEHFGFVVVASVAVGAVIVAGMAVGKSIYDAVKREREYGR